MGLFYVPTKATASLDTQMIGWMTNAYAYILAMMGGDNKYMTSPQSLALLKAAQIVGSNTYSMLHAHETIHNAIVKASLGPIKY
jgi:hypothetical protein